MVSTLKLELLESINIIFDLAKKHSTQFPHELCRFLTNEFNNKSAALYREGTENNFVIIGKSFTSDDIFTNNISVESYQDKLELTKFENNFVCECKVNSELQSQNHIAYLFVLDDKTKFLLLLQPKSQLNETASMSQMNKFVYEGLFYWRNTLNENKTVQLISADFSEKTNKGLVKDIKTINGLLTLINDEKLPNGINNYVNEIKQINNSLLNSLEDIQELEKLNLPSENKNSSKINISDFIDSIITNFKKEYNSVKFEFENTLQNEFEINSEYLNSIVNRTLQFLINLTKSNSVKVKSFLTDESKLRLSFITDEQNFPKEFLDVFSQPFENKPFDKFQSGLNLTILSKLIEELNGSIKLVDEHEFQINISIPISIPKIEQKVKISESVDNFQKDKILIIESDSDSSILLKNHLLKWNYSTDIINSGEIALKLIHENKYVAVILNIEQENENSLEILQKIKNNKSTRNTPVIVFTIEPEKEKIYLMGSVEYLVKPINYNNLVEILTSYKLRRNSTVLCVDDDQPTLNLLKQAVQTAGFNVIAHYRPEIVFDQIIDKDIDLAIIDLDMPKLNGIDLIKMLKSHNKFSKLPIIIYTGKEDYQEDLQKIEGMFVDLLEKKSTSFNELEKTIMEMIKSYEEPVSVNEAKEQSGGPKILMAEDYKHSQIIVTRLLKKSGFENVIVVENGQEALHICENDKIDLILMDMQMPVMNGFEATGKIRQLDGYAETPIIALTAFAMKGDREKCLEAGATDYIPKPIDSKEFIEKVKYYTLVEVKI